jgi:hypothetical protein
MNPVYLSSQIATVVRDARWAGGVRREHLQELLGCDHRELNQAIAIAYRRRTIDICWGWIVALPTAGTAERAA